MDFMDGTKDNNAEQVVNDYIESRNIRNTRKSAPAGIKLKCRGDYTRGEEAFSRKPLLWA